MHDAREDRVRIEPPPRVVRDEQGGVECGDCADEPDAEYLRVRHRVRVLRKEECKERRRREGIAEGGTAERCDKYEELMQVCGARHGLRGACSFDDSERFQYLRNTAEMYDWRKRKRISRERSGPEEMKQEDVVNARGHYGEHAEGADMFS